MAFTPLYPQQNAGSTGGTNPTPGFTPLGGSPTPPAPKAPGLLDKLGGDIAEVGGQLKDRFNNAVGAETDSMTGKTSAPEAGLRIFGQLAGAANDVIGGGVKAAAQVGNAATGGVAGNLLSSAIQKVGGTALGTMGLQAIQGGAGKWQQFATKYPRAAQDLQVVPEVANLLLNIGVGGEAKTLAEGALKSTVTGVKDQIPKVVAENAAKDVSKTVEAVNPDLTGKKLANAYKETVTGSRTASKGGILKEQALSPSQQAINVGTRLHDAGIALAGKPVQDLKTLGTAMTKTEGRINQLLEGTDPEIVYNADKPTLIADLNKVKTTSPLEFNAIKDSKTVHDSVVDFAKSIIAKAPDNVKGLREARTAFDNQAKKEFPSAFKEGMIDTKTPAGRAIKASRDTINEHLYNTAPQGSEIKQLIGREADIYRAAENIAPKAAATHGTSRATQLLNQIKKHKLVTAGVTYEGLKHTIAPSLPGI